MKLGIQNKGIAYKTFTIYPEAVPFDSNSHYLVSNSDAPFSNPSLLALVCHVLNETHSYSIVFVHLFLPEFP